MNERQRSIEKNVNLGMLLAFYAYLEPDPKRGQEAIDAVNKGMEACSYPRVPDVVEKETS